MLGCLLGNGLKRAAFAALLAASLTAMVTLAPPAHAQPAYVTCSSTRAQAIGTHHFDYAFGSVWVTLDKLVDSVNFSFCGSVRNHSQVRLTAHQSGGYIGGNLHYGQDLAHLNGYAVTSYKFVPNTGTSGETIDAWGPWEPGNCGNTIAVFVDGNSREIGDSGAYQGCA